ncbi:MAG: hypothetical protein LBP87_09175 [Planctomycetaceae bacterium]|jgi:hypothetical protein|nr:hypothetical protein [Planctomycetaceae bacterium]
MKYSSSIILILLLLSGCQATPHGQKHTVLVDSRQQQQQQQPDVAEKFLAKAAHFLQGVMPETGRTGRLADQENPQIQQVQPAATPDLAQAKAINPSAFYLPSSSKVSRPGSIQASQMLFNFDFAKNKPESNESIDESVDESVASVPPKPQKNTAKSNVLQPQNGDSESFRQLLKLIAKTPKEKRGVDDTKLEQLLTKFRNENWQEMPELETSYLLHLRNKILPNDRYDRSSKNLKKSTAHEIPDDEDELYAADYEKFESAPLPPSTSTSKSTPTSKSTLLKKIPTDSNTVSPVAASSKYTSRLRKPVPTEENTAENTRENTRENRDETVDLSETIPVVPDNNSSSGKPLKLLPPSVFTATERETKTERATETLRIPKNSSQPAYPKIAQLDHSRQVPTQQQIVPASYQAGHPAEYRAEHHPPYGNQYGTQIGQPTANNFGNNSANNSANNFANNFGNNSVSPNLLNNNDWESLVRMGANQLRNKIEQTPHGRTFANEGRLRILEMLLGNRNEAVKPIFGVDKPINEFMANQMLGFTAFLDETGIPEQRIRNTNALFRFDESLMELRKVCPIKLRKVQFVKEWDTFGCFIPRNEDCRAGEKLELYMELENPTIRHTQLGYNVSATVSYEIRDRAANVLQKVDHIAVQETTPSQKRDYCIGLWVLLPEKIPPGQYQLRISVTDMNDEAMSYAEEQVPFKVIPIANPEN